MNDGVPARGSLRAAGGECELQVWPNQMHVFQAMPKMTPEAAKAMAYVAGFIGNALAEATGAKAG